MKLVEGENVGLVDIREADVLEGEYVCELWLSSPERKGVENGGTETLGDLCLFCSVG